MKKALLYIFSLCCLLVYALSLDRDFMSWWADYRTYELHSPYARARYGDLYSNCFLPGYTDTAYTPLKKPETLPQKTALYIIHDSYLEGKIEKNNFAGISELTLSNYAADPTCVTLNPTKRNILILECSERTAEWRLTDTATSFSRFVFHRPPVWKEKETTPIGDHFFNPNINLNLEFSLYDYEYFIPIKELKGFLNFKLFNRLPKDVNISTNKKYLLLNETVNPEVIASSFRPLDMNYEDYVIQRANDITRHYKNLGFDEVYISIIPNPVSIIDRERMPYNDKILFLQNHPSANCRFLSVYDIFRQTPERIYRTDDSHWNGHGLQLWVDEVNKITAP